MKDRILLFELQGRNNLGNIFTFAAGNGGPADTCTADGFAQSIYTIPVGSYNQNGGPAFYDEKCSSKMTVAYVSNTLSFLQVVWSMKIMFMFVTNHYLHRWSRQWVTIVCLFHCSTSML